MSSNTALPFSPCTDTWNEWTEQIRHARQGVLVKSLAADDARLFRRFRSHYETLRRQSRPWRRRAQRRLQMSLGGVAMALALGAADARAAEIEVGPDCTLVQAIIAANGDMAEGGCTAGSGADTLILPGNAVFTYTEPTESPSGNGGPTALPEVTSEITIEGNNATIERSSASGTPDFRLMLVKRSVGDLTLRNTTLSGGSSPAVPGRGGSYNSGGAIQARGSLTVVESEVSGNSATHGSAIGAYSDLDIRDSVISDNDGSGAVYIYGGSPRITNSIISGNSGDGVRLGVGTLEMTDSTVSGNAGVGINLRPAACFYDPCSYFGDATITGSTVTGNSVGVFSHYYTSLHLSRTTVSGNSGVGIIAEAGDDNSVVIANATVSGNGGVGVYAGAGGYSYSSVRIMDSTVTGNAGGVRVLLFRSDYYTPAVTIDRSIVSGNLGLDIDLAAGYYNAPENFATRYSLLGDSSKTNAEAFPNVTPDSTDLTATSDGNTPTPLAGIIDPMLADNGGVTLTHAPVRSSPAIDVLPVAAGCPSFDQRGSVRPADGDFDGTALCDIGAVEFDRLEIASVMVPVRGGRQHNLIDGDPATAWGNDGDRTTAWFELHLPGVSALHELVLWPRINRAYEFRVLVDGAEVGVFDLASSPVIAPQTLTLPPGTEGSVVRVESIRNKFIKIHEAALTGAAVSQPLTIVDAEVLVRDDISAHLFDDDLTTFWRNDGNNATAQFELQLSGTDELAAFRLAPRTNRAYRFDVFADDVFVGEFTTGKATSIALQSFALPAGTIASRLRFVLRSHQTFKVYEVQVVAPSG